MKFLHILLSAWFFGTSTAISLGALGGVYQRLCTRAFGESIYCGIPKVSRERDCSNLCLRDPVSECSCIELLWSNRTLEQNAPIFNKKDLKKARLFASKCYHPDKGLVPTHEHQALLNRCFKVLVNPTKARDYVQRLMSILAFMHTSNPKYRISEEQCRGQISMLNEKWLNQGGICDGKRCIGDPPHDVTGDLVLLFLDDSGSMRGSGVRKGMKLFTSILSKLVDSQTSIFLVGSRGKGRLVHSEDKTLDEVALNISIKQVWTGGSGRTYLWEYIWEVVQNFSEITEDTEVIIITDGFDNESSEKFRGVEGFDELNTRIHEKFDKKVPRMTVQCVSSDCESNLTKDLAESTGGSYCTAEDWELCGIIFNLPEIARDHVIFAGLADYQKRVAAGTAKNYLWSRAWSDKD